MGKVIHYDFGYEVTSNDFISVCPKCNSNHWYIIVNQAETVEGQKIIAYECTCCNWRVDLTYPVAVVE